MRSLIVCLPLLALLVVAGCDKPKPKPEQANASAQAGAPELGPNGNILDRSHKGEAMPAMPFSAPGGAPATLTAFRGRPVLVNLWATWCGPCVKELPALDALAKSEAGKVKVIAVSQDLGGDKQVQPFWKAHGMRNLVAYTDPKMALMNALKIDVLPTTILYDSRGREVWRVIGGKDWTSADAAKLLAEAR